MGTHKSLNISVNNLHCMKVERYVCSLTMIPHQSSLSEWFVPVGPMTSAYLGLPFANQ